MKPGTIVSVAGREATVVYHNLDGYGVVWGRKSVDPENLPRPEALLREPFPTADYECVGREYEVLTQPAAP